MLDITDFRENDAMFGLLGEKLCAEAISADISAVREAGLEVVVHDIVDSTNSWSMQQCKAGKILPFACFAEEQTSGRGRRGKQWLMSPNSNIAMSLSWPLAVSGVQLHLLPLSIAMAIVATLEGLGLRHVRVKWPNDVLVQGKKIAGILIETQPVDRDVLAVVVGIGLNYEMPVKKVLKQEGSAVFSEITDVKRELETQEACRVMDRTTVAASLLKNTVDVMQSYVSEPKRYLEKFRSQYDYCKDKEVEIVLDNGEVLSGVAQGVNDSAELLVVANGEQQIFNSAEVSVKTL